MKNLTTIITTIFLLTSITTAQNYSLSFDGVDDYVSIDNADNVGDISVQIWFNPFEFSISNAANLFYQLEDDGSSNGREDKYCLANMKEMKTTQI